MKKHHVVTFVLLFLTACASNSSDVPQDMLLADQGYQELVNGNYERAEAVLNVALSINPENPYALLNLGVLYQNTGRIDDARRMYRRLIDLNPNAIAVQSTSSRFKRKKLVEIARENLSALAPGQP